MTEYKTKIRLNTASGVMKLQARIVNQLLNDEIEIPKAECVRKYLMDMIKAFETVNLEERFNELEAFVNEQQSKNQIR